VPIANVRNVNAALKREGIPLEFVRGKGYSYFVYDDPVANQFEDVSVYVPYVSQQSIERWVEDGRAALEEIDKRFADRGQARRIPPNQAQ
jgi:hypothetical protein